MSAEGRFGVSVTEGIQIDALMVAAIVGTCNFVNSLFSNLATKAHQSKMLQETVRHNWQTRELTSKTYEMTKNHDDRMFQATESDQKSLDTLGARINNLWEEMRSEATRIQDLQSALQQADTRAANRAAHMESMEARMSAFHEQATDTKAWYEDVERLREALQDSIDAKAADNKEQSQAMVKSAVLKNLEHTLVPKSEADVKRTVSQVALRMQYVHQKQSEDDVTLLTSSIGPSEHERCENRSTSS